jgi:hypothetical protein
MIKLKASSKIIDKLRARESELNRGFTRLLWAYVYCVQSEGSDSATSSSLVKLNAVLLEESIANSLEALTLVN